MGGLSLTHILLLALILLVFFGPSRLPQLGQSLGKAIRGFKQGLNEIDLEAKDVPQSPPPQQQITHQDQHEIQSQGTHSRQTTPNSEIKDPQNKG